MKQPDLVDRWKVTIFYAVVVGALVLAQLAAGWLL